MRLLEVQPEAKRRMSVRDFLNGTHLKLAIALVKSNSVSPARLAAFEILRRVEEGAYASVLLASREDELKPQDRRSVMSW